MGMLNAGWEDISAWKLSVDNVSFLKYPFIILYSFIIVMSEREEISEPEGMAIEEDESSVKSNKEIERKKN